MKKLKTKPLRLKSGKTVAKKIREVTSTLYKPVMEHLDTAKAAPTAIDKTKATLVIANNPAEVAFMFPDVKDEP